MTSFLLIYARQGPLLQTEMQQPRQWAEDHGVPVQVSSANDFAFATFGRHNTAQIVDKQGELVGWTSPTGHPLPQPDVRGWYSAVHTMPEIPMACVQLCRKPFSLWLARDRLGIATLYYRLTADRLWVSTEARLIAMACNRFDLSIKALVSWVAGRYRDHEPLFECVRGLERGVVVNRTDDEEGRRQLPLPPQNLGIRKKEDAMAAIRDLLRKQLVHSLDPHHVTGLPISGGMDSSTLAAVAVDLKSDHRLAAFAYRFKTLSSCDESARSAATAAALKLPLTYIDCEDKPILTEPMYPEQWIPENPFDSWNLIHEESLLWLTSQEGHVMLTGHGGDSMFSGIPPTSLRDAAWRLSHRFGIKKTPPIPWLTEKATKLLDPNMPVTLTRRSRQSNLAWDRMGGVRRAVHWLERFGRYYACLYRHPYMSEELLRFSLQIEPDLLWLGRPKGLMRQSMKGLLPDSVLQCLEKPHLKEFYRRGLKRAEPEIVALMDDSLLAEYGLIEPKRFLQAFRQYLDGSEGGMLLFSILTELFISKISANSTTIL